MYRVTIYTNAVQSGYWECLHENDVAAWHGNQAFKVPRNDLFELHSNDVAVAHHLQKSWGINGELLPRTYSPADGPLFLIAIWAQFHRSTYLRAVESPECQ